MTFHPVQPPRRVRLLRRVRRRVRWRALATAAAAGVALSWHARQGVPAWDLPLVGCAYLLLLAAAVASRPVTDRDGTIDGKGGPAG